MSRPWRSWHWCPNYWYEVEALLNAGGDEALVIEVGQHAAAWLEPEHPISIHARETGYFGSISEMAHHRPQPAPMRDTAEVQAQRTIVNVMDVLAVAHYARCRGTSG